MISNDLLVFLIALAVVIFFVVALSLTLIFKGHHIDSEIGDNTHMKERGISCTAQQIRNEEAALRGETVADCDLNGCASCTLGSCEKGEESEKA